MRLKICKLQKAKIVVRYDTDKFKEEGSRNHFLVKTESKFEMLLKNIDEKTLAEEIWHQTKDIYMYMTCADTKGKRPKPWISKETIDLAAKKKEARKANRQQEYKALKGAVQNQICKDKQIWVEEQCQQLNNFDRYNKLKNSSSRSKH